MIAFLRLFFFLFTPAIIAIEPSPQSMPNKIVIGAAISLTGKFNVEGKAVRDGYKMWETWVKRARGIEINHIRIPIEIIYEDDQSDPLVLASIYRNIFINKHHVHFILGPYSSELCKKAQEIAEENKVIMIQANGAAASLFTPHHKYAFGLQTTTKDQMRSILELLQAKEAGSRKTIVIAYEDDIFAKDIVEGVKKWASKYNMEIVRSAMYPHQDESVQNDPVKQTAANKKFETILGEFKKLNPDIFIGAGHFYDALRYVDVSKKLDFSPKAFIVTVGATDPRFVQLLKADANNIICPIQWDPAMNYKDRDPMGFGSASDYAARFRDIVGQTPSYHAAESSAAGLLLQLAIKQAQSVDIAKVLPKLQNIDITTFFGPIKFDNTGKNIAKPMGIMQIQNEKPVLVGPPSVLSREGFELVYPKPKWIISQN